MDRTEFANRAAELAAARWKRKGGGETPLSIHAELLLIRRCDTLVRSYVEAEEQLARALADLQFAYRKHHMGDDNIGWSEVGDRLGTTLAELMGDTAFQAWVQGVSGELEG